MPDHVSPVSDVPAGADRESPLHGYRGDRSARERFLPPGLTVAVSREAGSRGTSIAKRAATKLGWQMYTQEMLEYVAQESTAREEINANLSPAALAWVEEQLQALKARHAKTADAAFLDMARIILSLGATGEVLLIGRGAGWILPRPSTLHIRVVALLEDRVAYMSQWQRLTREEAAQQVSVRDKRRAEYLKSHFHRDVADIYQYDLLLNSTLLGEELSGDLLVHAALAKMRSLQTGAGGPPPSSPEIAM